nr:hypothetical protein [Paenibacillus elgii]
MALDGNLFTDYLFTDTRGNLIVKARQVRNFLARRQYIIDYYEDQKHHKIHLIDKKFFDLGEKTVFDFNGQTYILNKPLLDWGEITLDNHVIARWKGVYSLPFKANFDLIETSYEKHSLLLLAIFHTFLHSPK